MAWLEAHQDLRDHPKTKRAARALGISRPQMIGHLLCLWWWCLDYAEDGNLADFDSADIADAAEWEGEPDAFVDALLHCGPADRAGFLTNGDGLRINDWSQYGGKYVTKRNQGRDRQRTYRERNAEVTRYSSVSNTTREEESREDKKTEEKTKKEPPRTSNFPPGFDEFERIFKGNLLTTLQERDPTQRFQNGFSFSDTSKAALLQVMNSGPVLSSKAIDWALDQWEQAKPNERFEAYNTGCINWMLATIKNGYKPGQPKMRVGARPQGHNLREILRLDEDD